MAITLRQVYLVSSFILAAGLLSMGETNEAQGKHETPPVLCILALKYYTTVTLTHHRLPHLMNHKSHNQQRFAGWTNEQTP